MDYPILTTVGHGYTRNWITERLIRINRLYIIHGGNGWYNTATGTHPFESGFMYYLPWRADYTLHQNEDCPLDHTYINFISPEAVNVSEIVRFNPDENPTAAAIITSVVSLIGLCAKEHHPGFYCYEPISSPIPCTEILQACIREIQAMAGRCIHRSVRPMEDDISRVLVYISDNFRRKLTVEELAAIAHLNKRYFIKKFFDTVGCTPYQYIQALRYDTALILHSEGKSYSEAAVCAGFTAPSSFFRMLH